jgi:hypothetical protein
MSTRSEIFAHYLICDFVIQTPGKFEAEPAYAPYFYAQVRDGGCDGIEFADGACVDIVMIDATDRAMWPELASDTVAVGVEETDQGFVSVSELTQIQLSELEATVLR